MNCGSEQTALVRKRNIGPITFLSGGCLHLQADLQSRAGGTSRGLMQLGYQEGKDITFMVEAGEVASLPGQAANLSTAKVIDLDIPRSISERAEHVIE
jgi:hypothetical protein